MPLITPKQEPKKEKLTVEMNCNVLTQIHDYCKWAKVDIPVFIEEAAKFIFKKDKEYKTHLKTNTNRGKKRSKSTEPALNS